MTIKKCLNGIVCANVTPFDENKNVDYESLKRLTLYLIESGINAAYPSGTNGEGLALNLEERKKITKTMVETAEGKMPVVVQCGTQILSDTKELLLHAKIIGADAAGIITPFFFKQTQEALIDYYSSLFEAAPDFPIYIYNIPSHTNNDILPETMGILANRYDNFVGIKYSHPDLIRLSDYIAIKDGSFDALIGCDKLIYAASKVGAVGTVSGPAAVFPEIFTELWESVSKNDYKRALMIQRKIHANDNALSKYQGVPLLKVYLKSIGVISDSVCRIPFGQVSVQQEKEILEVIEELR